MADFTIDDIFRNNKKAGSGSEKKETKAKLQYIHYSELKGSEEEFYSLKKDDISRLAHSIVLCGGIKQPVTCRKTAPNEYEIISGHKRHAAVSYLAKHGYEEYEKIPCIVENYASDNVRQAELILTNYTQRERTAFEKMKEVQRLEEILKSMEESGELEEIWKDKNPSSKEEYQKMSAMSMREFIADALGISKTQVANLKNISSNLSDAAMEKFENGDLTVSAATQLAGMEKDKQDELVKNNNVSLQNVKNEKRISAVEKEMLMKHLVNFGHNKVKEAVLLSILKDKNKNCTQKAPEIRGLLNPNGYRSTACLEYTFDLRNKEVKFSIMNYGVRTMSWAAFTKLLVDMYEENYFKSMESRALANEPAQKEEPEQEEYADEQLPGQMSVEDYPDLLPDHYEEKTNDTGNKMSDSDIDDSRRGKNYYLFDYSKDDYFRKMEDGDICHFTECSNLRLTSHWKEGHVIELISASLKRSFKVKITYIEDGNNNLLLERPQADDTFSKLYYRIISFKKIE